MLLERDFDVSLDCVADAALSLEDARRLEGFLFHEARLLDERRMQPRDEVRFDDDVVVKEQAPGSARLRQQEGALLGHAAPRQVAADGNVDAAHAQVAQYRPHFRRIAGRGRFGLVGDDDAQRRPARCRERAQGDGQRRRPVAGGHQHVDDGLVRRAHGAVRSAPCSWPYR